MNSNGDSESGYVSDAELIGTISSELTNIRILGRSALSVTATAERFGHRWLLKSLPPSDHSTLSTQRLKKEFEILTGLNHPSIVKAFSLENVEGLGLSIVMEWIEGDNLEQMLVHEKLSVKEIKHIVPEIVEAVAYMHSKGIVHRDLKLSNIMVRKNGHTPVIVDFGLADTDAHITLKHAAGTVGYMSPEAYQKHEADTRDDVYSLGIILQKLSYGIPGVVGKCTAPQEKRYPNAQCLLMAINRRRAVGKALRWVTAAVITAAIMGAMGHEIALLQRHRGEDLTTVEMLRDSISNISKIAIEGERTISRLNDSISELRTKVSDAESRQKLIDIHNEEIGKVVKNGIAIQKAIFRQFDSEYVSSLQKEGMTLYGIDTMLQQTIASAINQYLEGARSSLSPDDFSLVYKGVWETEVMLYNDWQKNVLNTTTYD